MAKMCQVYTYQTKDRWGFVRKEPKYGKISLFAQIFFFSGILLLNAGNPDTLSDPPLITSFAKFGLNEGLPFACVESVFEDSKGRLWINPCVNVAQDFGLNFFQFDGKRPFFYDLRPPWLTERTPSPLWFIYGETTDGFLFGFDRNRPVIFSWRPDTLEQYFFQLGNGEQLLNLAPDPQGGILMLARKKDTYQVFRLFEGEKILLGSIRLDFTNMENIQFPYPFVVENQKAWFFHQRKGLVSIDLAGGTMNFRSWREWESLPVLQESQYDKYGLQWKLVARNDGDLLLFLGQLNGFFTLNTQKTALAPDARLNELVLKEEEDDLLLNLFFFQDKKKNLLIASGYLDPFSGLGQEKEEVASQVLLIDQKGNWYDYTNLKKQTNTGYELQVYDFPAKYFSTDFKRKFGWNSPDGLAIFDLRPDLGISAFQENIGARSILSIDSQTLLVNTDILNMRLNLKNGSYTNLPGEDFHVNGLSPFVVTEDRKVWMSRETGGLLWYDLSSNQFDSIPIDVVFDQFLFLNEEEAAFFSRDGELYLYNLRSGAKRPFLYKKLPFSVDSKVNELLLTEDSILWVGAQNGLWQIDFNRAHIIHYDRSPLVKGANVLCLHEGEEGVLWLGTSRLGLLIFNPNTDDVKQLAEVHGLSNNTVAGILADDRLNRWVATFNGITVVSPELEILFEIDQSHGLTHGEFNRTSYAKLPDGRLAFGGIKGINILDPDYILQTFAEEEPLQIFLTRLEYFSKKKNSNVVYEGSYPQTKAIQIPAANRYLILDFAISEYVNKPNHTYAYRLIPKGLSKEQAFSIPWINLGATSQLTVNNLPVGAYIVQIRGVDHQARQVAEPLEIQIQVNDFFYRTWWFFLLCALTFSLGAWIWIRRLRTEKKRLEIEVDRRTAQIRKDKAVIERQAEQLQEIDQAKTRFFTNLSHEFRTPLTVILGMVEQDKDPGRARKLIRRNANHLLRLINQILDLEKLESGNLPVRFVQGDVVGYLQYMIESFHSLAEDKGISLTFQTDRESLVLDYDPEKLLYIVSNLLINAVKFTPPGGVVKIALEADREVDAPWYQFSVADTGVGIPAEKLPRIFDRFYQVDDPDGYRDSRTGAGTGIGLTLVRDLVRLLDGTIRVESRPGQGATFVVRLPYTNQAALGEGIPDSTLSALPDTMSIEPSPSVKPGNTDLPTLLIVEDNPDVTEYLVACLEGDYQLLLAADGLEGLDTALEKVPDIIISDVMMPKMDGFTLCNTLKTDERTSHIPIVLLTAKADVESRITGLKRGADAYLAKPFDKRELGAQLKTLLTLRRQLQIRYSSLEDLDPSDDIAIRQEDTFITRIRQTILENMAEEGFGVPELCKKAAMSRTQLHNKIKSLTGRSASHFIRMVRVQKASELLRESDWKISQIALEVGIESPAYFSRTFSQETGLSPHSYREKFRSAQ